MARALECPACGARHGVDTLPDAPTFRCERCGQVLKVPEAVQAAREEAAVAPAGRDGAAAGASASASAAAPPPPPPRRRGGAAPTGPTVSATSSATATLPAAAAATTVGARASGASGGDGAPPATRGSDRAVSPPESRKVRLYWRIVAWVVAVPLGFVITAWPAFEFGLIEKDDVLDVFVGEGTGRYVRLLVGVAIWALVTAMLVQLFVEGGRAWAARRRVRSRAARRGRRSDPRPGVAPAEPA